MNVCRIFVLMQGFFLPLFFCNAYAAEPQSSIGSVAENLVVGAGALTHFLHFVCVVAGLSLIVLSFSLYRAHRFNPKYVPLDKPIMYLVFGIILIAVPFFGEIFGETGSPEYLERKEAREKGIQTNDIDAPLNWGTDYNH